MMNKILLAFCIFAGVHGVDASVGFGAKPILVYNEDSDNVFRESYHANANRYEETEFRQYLENVIGPGKITHFFMDVNARVANFPSKTVGTYWDCLDIEGMDHPAWIAAMKDFVVGQGKDHVKIWTGMCREKGVSPWVSIRMNDIHCVYDPKFFANVGFWKDHPEFWCDPSSAARKGGPWSDRALDYSHKEVRDWMLSFVAEVLERYDPDGLEVDWMRFEHHFPKGRERELSGALDETMREIRKLVDAAAKRRSHPILVAARVDSDPRSALNHGTDWRVWAKEKLVDWLIPCNFFNTVDFDLPYSRWVGEVKRLNPNVTIIPGLDCGVVLNGKRRLLTADEYCAWGERMDNQGAPGAYFFNLFSFYSQQLAGYMGGGSLEPWQVIVKDGFTSKVIRDHARSVPAGATRECAPWLRPQTVTCDLVVYGSSPAALTAAIEAKTMGKTVVIVSPEVRIGGLTTGGLGQTDIGNKSAFGGLALSFYRDVADFYRDPARWTWQKRNAYLPDGQCTGSKGEDSMWTFEPSAALQILEGWEKAHALDIRRGERLDRGVGGVETKDGRIVSFRTLSGDVYRGKVFVDATYEGDLMAAAGVSAFIGREDNSVYGETLDGAQPKQGYHHLVAGVSPYVKPGDPSSGLLPCIEKEPMGAVGTGDRRVQAYCYRMCLTDVEENRIPFAKPDFYDELNYELLFRNFEAAKKPECLPWINSKMPNRKTDTNNRNGVSTDFIGQNHGWPEASYAERDRMQKAHLDYQRGLMWSLANHPRVPARVRNEVARWGTCRDEFTDGFGDGWQRQLYVREARRLVGETVMTEKHCRGEATVARPIAMAAYQMDSHHVRRYVGADGFVHNEGDVEVGGGKPYPIDYGAIIPKRGECVNLLVPVCMSASHIAFGSIRMEPVFFALGQAAGAAAALAVDGNGVVQDVAYPRLRERLLADGQVLERSLNVGLKPLGTLQNVGTRVERGQPWMLGCETLDRDFTDFDSYKAYLEPLGIKRIRLQCGWAKCEKEKGKYDFAWLDHVVDYAAERGIRSVLETDYGNPLYGNGKNFHDWTDAQWAAWEAWVKALAEHFKGRVEDFLMWNEPDTGKLQASPEVIARQNVRTAKVIKSVVPTARIGAFGYASCKPAKFKASLAAMGEDAKLFTWVVYHGYVPNPDAGQGVPEKWGAIVAELAPHLKLFQGEQGAPSKRLAGYALADHDWTELSQAKWDLRRYLGDIGHGAESSVFTIADICYKDKGIHNAKGLLATDLDCKVIGVKKSYRAVQNMVSVFDDSLELLAGTRCPFTASVTNLSLYAWRTKAGGKPLAAFWDNQGLVRKCYPTESVETRPATLVMDGSALDEPVWVDLISGRVYAFPKDRMSAEAGKVTFRDVPFYDAPCLLTERSALKLKDK